MSKECRAWFNDSPVKDNVVTNDRWVICDTMEDILHLVLCSAMLSPKNLHKRKLLWVPNRGKIEYFYTSCINCELQREFCMNVGPTSYPTIKRVYEEGLLQFGKRLK